MEWLATYWPVLVGFGALAVAWGETRAKVAELREWRRSEERRRSDEAKALEEIRLDVREIKTVLRIREGEG